MSRRLKSDVRLYESVHKYKISSLSYHASYTRFAFFFLCAEIGKPMSDTLIAEAL